MPTFTGYEPNKLVGKGPGNAPTQTTGSASSSSAAQQIVPAETPADDLSNLFDAEMSSLLEDMFEEPLEPIAGNIPSAPESGLKGFAAIATGKSDRTLLDEPASSSLKQARISADGQPKDDEHHGKPAKQARFSEQLISFEPDDLLSGMKVLAQSSDSKQKDEVGTMIQSKPVSSCRGRQTPAGAGNSRRYHGLDDFQSTSQSSCSSGLKGFAKALAPHDSTVASTDSIVTADHVVNLEAEIAQLRKALSAKDVELSETKVHAESYASKALRDSRSKAEQALAFQKSSFETAHAEYSLAARDICDSEVAQSVANLEAIANSVIGQQQQELETATIIVSNLQQHLGQAQSQVAQEAKEKLLIESKAKAHVDAQKAASAQQLSTLRVSLENDAQASHSNILNAREKQIKAEAEELHSASMKQEQQSFDRLQAQLQTAMLDIKKLRSDLDTSISNYSDSEAHLAQVQTELRKTQESLVTSNGLLAQSRQNRELLEKDVHDQLNSNHRLQAEIVVLRSNVDELTLSLKTSQSDQQAKNLEDYLELDSMKQAAEETIKQLKEQLSAQTDLHQAANAQAKAEIERLQLVCDTNCAEELSSQAAKLQAEHDEVLAELNFKFNNAQAAIAAQNDEIEEMQNLVQAKIDENFELQQAMKGRENFRLDADDSVIPPQPAHATSSTSPVFYPKMNLKSGMKVLAHSADAGAKDLESGTKVFAPHAATDDQDEHARRQTINDQIAPLAGQIAQENNGSQYGGNTPNLSAIPAPPATFAYGKKVSERIIIGGWPTMKGFVNWKLAFLKAVAAASITPDEAFVWICAVMKAKSYHELNDSGNFPALDALLSTEWDKILTGEFKNSVRVIEFQLLKNNIMLKGRQVTWLVFDHFRLSDVDGAMLNWDEILSLKLHMPGDNIKQFLNDWDTTFTNVNGSPDPEILESLFKRQLDKSILLKNAMALYDQEVTQRQATRSYKKLRYIVDNYLSEALLKKNQASLAKDNNKNANNGIHAGIVVDKSGYCKKWANSGECKFGAKCHWADSHTAQNKNKDAVSDNAQANASTKGKGEGKGKNKDGVKQERGRPTTKEEGRAASPARKRGKSPSGDTDRPACYRWLKGLCADKECKYWHSPPCKDFKAGKCTKGAKCEFVHMTDKVKENIEKTKAGAHCARFSPHCSMSEDVYLHFLNAYGPQCRGARCKAINFSLASPSIIPSCSECVSLEASPEYNENNLPELIDDTTADERLQASHCMGGMKVLARLENEEDDNTDDDISSDDVIIGLSSRPELSWLKGLVLPQVRGARAHLAKTPHFSKKDVEKSQADAIAPRDKLWHMRNPSFKPHRTDSDGNVTFDDHDTIENYEEHARRKALNLRFELEPESVDVDSFFITGTADRKVYSSKPFSESDGFTTVLTKSQKRKLRKQNKKSECDMKVFAPSGNSEEVLKGQKPLLDEDSAMFRTSSPSNCQPRPRRYIVDSGASFHLVDPRTLTKKEHSTIEDIEVPIPIETANGEVTVSQRCRVRVIELNIEVWAFLHVDTVCVLSLGLLVDRNGFTYNWRPGKAPELKKGSFVVSCAPHYNVPFIYASTARGLPHAQPRSKQWTLDDLIEEEMKGLEDLIPPPPPAFSSKDGDSVESAGRKSSRGAPRRRSWG